MQEVYTDLESKNKSELYGWIFQYNPFREVYEATRRSTINELWNGEGGNVLRARSHAALEELIIKTGGDKTLLEDLIKNQK